MIRIVHIVNQFFAGIGGEDKAGIAVGVSGHLTGYQKASDSKVITETAKQFLEKIRKVRS